MTKQESLYQLETMIDKYGLPQVVELMSDICKGKASHVRENWPESKSIAKLWDKNASILDKTYPVLYS